MASSEASSDPSTVENESQMQITKEFLLLVFEKPLKSFEVKAGSSLGDNYLTVLHKVHVSFEDPKEQDTTILIKAFPSHPARQYFLTQCGMFEREYFVYNILHPELMALVENNDSIQIPLPPFLGGNIPGEKTKFSGGPWEKDTFIIMSDLRVEGGYRNTDRMKGLDFEHASLVVGRLAMLHALSWAYKEKHNLKLITSKYPILQDFAFVDSGKVEKVAPMFIPMLEGALQSVRGIIEQALGASHPATIGLIKLLSSDYASLMQLCLSKSGGNEEKLEELLRMKSENNDGNFVNEPWMVVTHGDSWSNNFMFKYDCPANPNKPMDVKLVDFQITREVCPTLDLAYLLFGSVRTKVRKGCEKQLLEIYFNTFCTVCSVTGTDPLPGFTVENLLRKYRRAKIFGVLQVIPCLLLFLLPSESAENLDKVDNGQIQETVGDVMQGSLGKGLDNSNARNELIELVLDLYEDGIL